MISELFIHRPKFAIVIAILMVLAGVICVSRIPIAEYPEIAPPTINVRTTYEGASAQTVMETVGIPLEQELNGLENLLYFSSTSDNSGGYSVNITFKSGSDSDINMVNVQNALKRVEHSLPTEVVNQGITIKKRTSDILGFFSFRADPKKMSNLQLNNYVKTRVKDVIARIDGIASSDIMGAKDYSMRIWLDSVRMSALNITPGDVAAAIREQNIQAAAGSIGDQSNDSFVQYKVNVTGRLKTVEEFSNIIVRTSDDGDIVKIRDIARIELGAESYTGSSRANGKTSVNMAVYRNDDSNALETMKTVKKTLEELKVSFPDGVSYEVSYDPTEYIIATMYEIIETLVIALLLVVGITYLFLQDWRATLIPALAIPVSLLGTFVILLPLGFSINVLTMFGLILVIGSLVDDGIIVVENTIRLMDTEGLSPLEATKKSMHQITGAIIATTLVTVAIYIPIAFIGGMVGNIYLQFSVTMCVALCLSAVNALTLSPALCVMLLKKRKKQRRFNIFRPFNATLEFSRRSYLKISGVFVRRAWLTLLALAAVLFADWKLFEILPSSFLPQEDKGTLFVDIQLPPGAALSRTEEARTQAEVMLMAMPGVRQVSSVTGFSFTGGSGENVGMCIVQLQPWNKRTTPDLQIDALLGKAQGMLATIPSANIKVFSPPAIMGLGVTGGISFMLQAAGDETPKQLEQHMNDMLDQIRKIPGVVTAFSSYEANTPQLFMHLDRQKAQTMHVPVNRIFSTLQGKLASLYVNDFNMDGYAFKVKIQSDTKERVGIRDIMSTYIQNNEGEMVPLSSVATLSYITGPRQITRYNQLMCANIQCIIKAGSSSGEIMKQIESLKLPANYSIAWTDMSYQERENDGQILFLMMLAFIFGYLFLVAQYESWTTPMSVIVSVSVAIMGALAGLLICGSSLSIYAQLGLVMLVGLASKNAILMVEFSKEDHERGATIQQAALNGASQRFRAVLMTAISFIIGVFPMVIATGAGAASRQAIGITTFYGMICATCVGILLIPGLYSMFQRMREFTRNKVKRSGRIHPQKNQKKLPDETATAPSVQ